MITNFTNFRTYEIIKINSQIGPWIKALSQDSDASMRLTKKLDPYIFQYFTVLRYACSVSKSLKSFILRFYSFSVNRTTASFDASLSVWMGLKFAVLFLQSVHVVCWELTPNHAPILKHWDDVGVQTWLMNINLRTKVLHVCCKPGFIILR